MILLPNQLFFAEVEAMLAEGREVQIRMKGHSMRPLLRSERDQVVLTPCTDPARLRPGDVVLFRCCGRHILHRIVRRDGDRLVPFGEAKPKPLKKLRCDRKIPAGSPLPVLRTNAGTILWAPGIRHSNHAAATPATARLVRFACAAIPAEVQGAGTGTPSGN